MNIIFHMSTSCEPLILIFTIISIFSIFIKDGPERSSEYIILINLLISCDIYLMMKNFGYDNINIRLPPYTLLGQKEILRLFEITIF